MRLVEIFLITVVGALAAVWLWPPGAAALDAPEIIAPQPAVVITDIPIPEALSLCGEAVPLDNAYAAESLDRELVIAAYDYAQVIMWLKRAGRYFPYIEQQLAARGMPDDLKYLAVAESSLIDYVRSRAGATGTWQFMSLTAKKNGLRHHGKIDDRRNFELSTDAALKHLHDLKDTFGKWNLAMAAYNCGEACVESAISQQRVQDYYRLNLPRETERYVFRIAAIKVIMENPGRYGYHIADDRIYRPIPTDTVAVKLTASIHMTDFAQALGTDCKVIKELNPQFIGYHFPMGQQELRVPAGKGKDVARVLASLSRSSAGRRAPAGDAVYTVRAGDSLSKISEKTGVSVDSLKSLNELKGSVIRKGQKLRLE
jgi:membrane-bound lytic murein transglycosylase D